MALNLGMHIGQDDRTYEDLKRAWRLADSAGFYWVSIGDHFYQHEHGGMTSQPVDSSTTEGKGTCFEGVSIMTALAAETTNVRVGSLVFCMGYRHPTVLAKAAATIDHVSNGRLELGLGAGWYEREHNAYGIPFPPVRDRMDILEEGIQIIKSMLTQESSTFMGTHFQVTEAYCFPRPVQRPPRIWIGGKGEQRTLRIAARYADGWDAPSVSPEEYRHKIQVLEHWCEVDGRDPAEITRSVEVGFYMGADQADANRLRRRFQEQWGDEAEERSGWMLFGTASEVIDRIGAYADAGAQGLNIGLRAPYNWEALQAFAEEVVPAFS